MKVRCYIFDIDGTLADNSHRTSHLEKVPKDWDAYHKHVRKDKPISHMVTLLRHLNNHAVVVFCSGRHDGQKEITVQWLLKHTDINADRYLYMRKEGDHRPDHIIKIELLDKIRADGFEPIMVFDDRNSVVKMWRDVGVPCAQVAEGNF